MTTTADPTLDQVFDLAARLSPADKLRLIERLAPQVLPAVQLTADTPTLALPVIEEGTWSDDIPTSRSELYDDHGR